MRYTDLVMRLKHVFQNPYHIWANQAYAKHGSNSNHARNSSGNRSFCESRAYSYNALIANIVTRGKKRAYLLSPRLWSVTTSRHQSEVRRAIPHGETVLYVPILEPNQADHDQNLEYLIRQINEYQGKAERARKEGSKGAYLSQVTHYRLTVKAYCEFFGLKSKMYRDIYEGLENALEAFEAHQEAERAKRAKRAKRQAREHLKVWLSGGSPSQHYWYSNLGSAYLRVCPWDENIIQTSQMATVPVESVRAVLSLVLDRVKSGKGFKPNGKRISIGHYELLEITTSGDVIVGCHRFEKSEVLRFAKVLTG